MVNIKKSKVYYLKHLVINIIEICLKKTSKMLLKFKN